MQTGAMRDSRSKILALLVAAFSCGVASGCAQTEDLTPEQWAKIEAIEQARIEVINEVVGSVVAIYGETREGGGSGVIIDPTGIALTNHHVIMGAGTSGWGGLADGHLYRWKLIGTDPGGDVSIIQLEAKDSFPFTLLGDSDQVRTGDWALAMGNPFVLTEDQVPTVTLGIVSGVKRYQPGAGANQLVYGNCIQIDSSINPGNSGGPLFSLHGRVVGINGRGSFRDRGRVNVGLGYAISSNQIKNFIPDLLATKLVEHGTLDANFADRQGRVVCSMINRDSPIAAAGLNLGDELIEFEGEEIENANHFTNLICTLPADWPASLKIRKSTGEVVSLNVRLLGLPYPKPRPDRNRSPEQPGGDEEDELKEEQQRAMLELLSAPAGKIRHPQINRRYADLILAKWREKSIEQVDASMPISKIVMYDDWLKRDGELIGMQTTTIDPNGRFIVEWEEEGELTDYRFDGKRFFKVPAGQDPVELSLVEAKRTLPIVQALGMLAREDARTWDGLLGGLHIDGSDKAQNQVAYRIASVDSGGDKFYYWLRYEDKNGNPSPQLLKASAEKNCDESGGVTFGDWHFHPQDDQNSGDRNGFWFARRREFIKGLGENQQLLLENKSVDWIDEADPSLFGSTHKGKP